MKKADKTLWAIIIGLLAATGLGILFSHIWEPITAIGVLAGFAIGFVFYKYM